MAGTYSICFLSEDNLNFILTSHSAYYRHPPIIAYDFKGNCIKKISDSNEDTIYIDTLITIF